MSAWPSVREAELRTDVSLLLPKTSVYITRLLSIIDFSFSSDGPPRLPRPSLPQLDPRLHRRPLLLPPRHEPGTGRQGAAQVHMLFILALEVLQFRGLRNQLAAGAAHRDLEGKFFFIVFFYFFQRPGDPLPVRWVPVPRP